MDSNLLILLNQLQSQGITAMVASVVLQWLKGTKTVGFITQQSRQLNMFLNCLFALAFSLGITFSYTGSLVDGGSLVVSFPALVTLVRNFLTQWGMQEGWYQAVVKGKSKNAGNIRAPEYTGDKG